MQHQLIACEVLPVVCRFETGCDVVLRCKTLVSDLADMFRDRENSSLGI